MVYLQFDCLGARTVQINFVCVVEYFLGWPHWQACHNTPQASNIGLCKKGSLIVKPLVLSQLILTQLFFFILSRTGLCQSVVLQSDSRTRGALRQHEEKTRHPVFFHSIPGTVCEWLEPPPHGCLFILVSLEYFHSRLGRRLHKLHLHNLYPVPASR